MDNWFFYSAIRAVSLQLCDAFTGLKVAKVDAEGNIKSWVDVPLNYGLKDKWYYWLNDKKQHHMFPIMGLHLTQLQMDTNRAVQKQGKIRLLKNKDGSDVNPRLNIREMLAPSPWKITYQLAIASKTVIEVEQILEQILPFFNPFLMLNIPIIELPFDYDAKVILGTVSPDTKDTLDMDESRPVNWTVELVVDAYLFKPVRDISTIRKIILQYYDENHDENQVLTQAVIDGTKDPVTTKLLNYYWDKEQFLT